MGRSYGHAALHACLTQLLGPTAHPSTNTFTNTNNHTNSPPAASVPSPLSSTPSAPSPLKTEPEDPHTPTAGETPPSPGPLLVFFNNDATPDGQVGPHPSICLTTSFFSFMYINPVIICAPLRAFHAR